MRDRAWFFGALRFTDNKRRNGPDTGARCRAPRDHSERNRERQLVSRASQPWVKVTARLAANHDLAGVYQGDRLHAQRGGRRLRAGRRVLSTGGPMYGGKLTSVWGQHVTTTFSASYNKKGGNALDSYEGAFPGRASSAPRAFTIRAVATGTGLLVTTAATVGGPRLHAATTRSSVLMLRGDLTWFEGDNLAGSHEFQTGFLALPPNNFDKNVST